jgi:predicted nucleic acid-binding protein
VILADTSVWVDHLRAGDPILAGLLVRGAVLAHPWVIGEIALGRLGRRAEVLALLGGLPQATVATTPELAAFIERHELHGRGIAYVDAQLLAATRLTPDATLWTRDRRLAEAAAAVGVLADPGGPPAAR